MTRDLSTEDQRWHSVNVRGIPMQACRLWEGKYNVESGLYRMAKGLTIPSHHHSHWCQVFVVSGTIEVQADAEEARIISAGGYYFVEPGDTHRETAVEDSLLLVICEESRPEFKAQPQRTIASGVFGFESG